MAEVAGQMGKLTRAVAFATIVCAVVLRSLAFSPLPSATFGATAAISVFIPADDCKNGGGAPLQCPLHDRGHCALCVSCGAGAYVDPALLVAKKVAFAPMRNVAAWRGGDDDAPSSSASGGAWRARAPPASA